MAFFRRSIQFELTKKRNWIRGISEKKFSFHSEWQNGCRYGCWTAKTECSMCFTMAWAGKDWTDPRIGAWQGCWEWKGNLWYEMKSHFTKRSVRIRSTLRHLKRDQLALTWAEWSNTENAYQPACKFDNEQKWTKVNYKVIITGPGWHKSPETEKLQL